MAQLHINEMKDRSPWKIKKNQRRGVGGIFLCLQPIYIQFGVLFSTVLSEPAPWGDPLSQTPHLPRCALLNDTIVSALMKKPPVAPGVGSGISHKWQQTV